MSENRTEPSGTSPRRYKPYAAYKDSGVEWLGEIPAHWRITKMWDVAQAISGGTPAKETLRYWDGDIPWVSPKDMKRRFIDSSEDTVSAAAISETGLKLVPTPAVLVVVRGMILAHSFPVGITKVPVTINQDMKALRLRDDVDPEFFGYWLEGVGRDLLTVLVDEAAHGTKAIRMDRWRVTPAQIPPEDEQRAIVEFLDRERAKIDALVAKKERVIELLEEKRAALIAQAVTKGLDPNVPMKASDVEWLGEIPTHWECLALARVTVSRCDGPFGSGLKSEHYSGTGIRVVRLQNIGWAVFSDADRAYIDEAYAGELGDHSVVAGDLLIAGLGDERHPVGRACTAPEGIEPAMVKADCFRFRLDQTRLLPRFAAYQLSVTAAAAAGSLATGATRSRMNLGATATRKVALPPLEEQCAIVEVLDRDGEQFEMVARRVRGAIDRLKELRAALTSSAVTGRIDVRNETV